MFFALALILAGISLGVSCEAWGLLALRQRELDGDSRFTLDRVAIDKVGFVSPLLDRLNGRVRQQPISRNDVDVPHRSVAINNNVQHHRPLDFLCSRFCWILRLHAMDQASSRVY